MAYITSNALRPSISSQLAQAAKVPLSWYRRAYERRALASLLEHNNDYLAHDIGLSRSDIARAAATPFWKPLNNR